MQRNSALDVLPGDAAYVPPPLDSHESILLLLNQVLRAQFAGKIDLQESKFCLQLVNTALRVLKEKEKKAAEAAKTAEQVKAAASLVNDKVTPKPALKPAPTTSSESPSAKTPQPAYKGDRIYDPYGCMPKV